LALAGLVFGFLLFATEVTRQPATNGEPADAIVALTGGKFRIRAAARLLQEGRATRLLISGVNRKTPRDDIRRITGLKEPEFACCVDLDYAALNTRGNADEARAWARKHDYRSLIVVTSSYHMPRSLAELARVMPDVKLIPHRVVPKSLQNSAWWLNADAARLLVGEYVKFLPAAANLAMARLMGDWTQSSLADHDSAAKPARI